MELSKVMMLKTILLCFNYAEDLFCNRFTFITRIFLKVIKGQGPLEGEGTEVVASKYLPGTYFSL